MLFISAVSYAQSKTDSIAVVTGKVLSLLDSNAIEGMQIAIPRLKILTTTNEEGIFRLEEVYYGVFTLIISNGTAWKDSLKIFVDGRNIDLGILKVNFNVLPLEIMDKNDAGPVIKNEQYADNEEITAGQSISGMLNIAKDPYLAIAASSFSAFRYHIRGYKNAALEVYMNGLLMNDLKTGTATFGQWGGLPHSFRNQNISFALQSAEDGFGGLIGLASLSSAAAEQRKQANVTYGMANSTYRNEVNANYSTGLMTDGWAFSFSFSKRWAKEGYVEGTAYDRYSFYIGASKKLNNVSMLHCSAYATPTTQGLSSATTLEAMALAGTPFYNPDWGYLNGAKRNAKVNHSFQPLVMLHYDYTPDNNTKVSVVGTFQKGYNGSSALDWYNAQDPRPDYYKNLPSYYENDESTADPVKANALRTEWQSSLTVRQLDWNRMYEANLLNKDIINGIAGKRAVYMVGENREDSRKYSFAVNLQKVVHEHLQISSGVSFMFQQMENYRKMLDLLAGDYYVDLNQFAERTYVGNSSFNQNDLNNPNRIVKAGDRYAYNYTSVFRKLFAWGQLVYTKRKIDFFLAARLMQDGFRRDGLYKNGLFPEDSYGKSMRQQFYSYQLKSGITYKIDGHQYLYVNAAAMTAAPLFNNTFIAPSTRNTIVDQPVVERTQSLEAGYKIHAPKLTGSVSGFATQVNDGTKIMRFYHDDYRTFVNYVMRNLDVRYLGGALALQMKISPSFSVAALASWTQVFYNANPEISIYRDNDTTANVGKSIAYLKNTFLAVGPQSACHLGLDYRSRKLWYFSMGFNYLNRNYMDLNPVRRTEAAVNLLSSGSEEWHRVVDQQELSAAFTVDLLAGKSYLLSKKWKGLPKGTSMYINVGISNLLNNKNIQVAGAEQLRFDATNANPDQFPPKYSYGFGTNYVARLGLRF